MTNDQFPIKSRLAGQIWILFLPARLVPKQSGRLTDLLVFNNLLIKNSASAAIDFGRRGICNFLSYALSIGHYSRL
jgi:hypothetical protein